MVEATEEGEPQQPNLVAQLETAEDNDIQVDFKKNKKKKKKKVAKDGDAGNSNGKKPSAAAQEQDSFNWNVEGHKEYEYAELLDRIETIVIEKSTQDDEEAKDVKGELPITKFISIKTSIMNFDVLCQQLDRDPTHLLDYIKTEMDVDGNFGAEGNVML